MIYYMIPKQQILSVKAMSVLSTLKTHLRKYVRFMGILEKDMDYPLFEEFYLPTIYEMCDDCDLNYI